MQHILVAYARQIAVWRNHTDLTNGLQPKSVLKAKFEAEVAELQEALERKTALHALHEAADVLYYAASLEEQTGRPLYESVRSQCLQLLEAHGIHVTKELLDAVAQVKYAWRASGPNTKDEAYELQLIQDAIVLPQADHYLRWTPVDAALSASR